jgi:ribonuclease D
MSLDKIFTDADGCYELSFEDDSKSDDDSISGWQDLKSETSKETATAPFTCTGTSRRRHHTINRVNLRDNHLVELLAENPVQFKRKRSCNQSLSDSSCDESWQVDWIKCIDCLASDTSFEKEVSAQSPRIQKRVKKIKRKKEEKKEKSEEIIKKAKITTKIITDPDEIDLLNWMRGLEKCTLDQLKSLCRANGSLVSGPKIEVVERLVRCKRHGSPGLCPECDCVSTLVMISWRFQTKYHAIIC